MKSIILPKNTGDSMVKEEPLVQNTAYERWKIQKILVTDSPKFPHQIWHPSLKLCFSFQKEEWAQYSKGTQTQSKLRGKTFC